MSVLKCPKCLILDLGYFVCFIIKILHGEKRAGIVGAVGKIFTFQPQGPQFDPGSAEIESLCDLVFRLS